MLDDDTGHNDDRVELVPLNSAGAGRTVAPEESASADVSESCSVRTVETLTSIDVLVRFGHALSDPTRARVLVALRAGAAYPTELAENLGVTRTGLSNHLACLRGCGLVVAVPEGKRMRYELADGGLRTALDDLLGTVLAGVDGACAPARAGAGCC